MLIKYSGMCVVIVPVSHCKDTYNFDKTNNFFKKVKEKGDQVSDLLCPKLTELSYEYGIWFILTMYNSLFHLYPQPMSL